ncbi:hybrid sensor histidine kinase/response regulator [Lacisediminimonas profundi]|uniref:hybrid sensor histidine kinase/response regulator n=1 Tax=Lacisediminimonas profundi TaxID=2603856 RepID=UPI001F4FE636|nr:Hpt domain-containing protein [Lacisediminimonas profundi]
MTSLSNLPVQTSSFDTGPLSWVMNEIREALQRSRTLVDEALKQDPETQSTSLRQARSFLHQAHGALQVVDIDGVSVITDAIEKMLDSVLAAKPVFSEGVARAHGSACVAIVEYLEELLSGGMQQPVRLFPYYKSVLQASGNEKAHPSDLFFPNLAIRPQLPVEPRQGGVVEFASLRQRFERALLPFLRSSDAQGECRAAGDMAALVAEVERAQASAEARRFWWVLRGFAEGVAGGEIPAELHVKQLFGRINLQLRRLADGSQGAVERLVRDALFFIAAASRASGRTAQVRSAYQLDGQVPEDYERRRYGQVDGSLLAATRERLNEAKNLWSRLVSGDSTVGAQFEKEMQALADAGAKLQAPSLEKLLRELNGIARAAHSQPGEVLALEMAGSLLFVENALNHTSRLSDSFAERAEALTARLLSVVAGEQPGGQTQWLDDMSRDAQQKETVSVLAGEMATSLSQVEKGLEEFFGDCTRRAALPVVDATLHQIEGALAILEQDDARLAVADTRAAVSRFAALPPEQGPDSSESHRVARNLGALSFFLETLQKQPNAARERFSFDSNAGSFHARMADPDRSAGLDVVVDPLPEPVPEFSALPELPELPSNTAAQPVPAVDSAAIPALEDPVPSLPSLDIAPKEAAAAAVVSSQSPAPASISQRDAEVDAELLEIFLGEAEEVLECVTTTLPMLEAEPSSTAHLTTLRRSFHTLKGSGRMVGLSAFGDAAWSIEQVLNLRLADAAPATAPLTGLLHAATTVLGRWVSDLRTSGTSGCTPDALVAAAQRVKDGADFHMDAEVQILDAAAVDAPPIAADLPGLASGGHAFTLTVDEEIVASMPSADSLDEWAEQDDRVAVAEDGISLTFDIGLDSPDASGERALPVIGEGDGELATDFPELDVDADLPVETAQTGFDASFELSVDEPLSVTPGNANFGANSGDELPVSAHGQSSDDVAGDEADEAGEDLLPAFEASQVIEADFEPVAPFAAAPVAQENIARVIDLAAARPVERRIDDNIKRIGTLEISLPLYNIYLAETDDLVRLLSHDFAEWRHEPERPVHTTSVHAAHSLAGSSATVGFMAVHEIAHALEMILQSLARRPVQLLGSDFMLMQQSVERIRSMLSTFALGDLPADEPSLVQALEGRLADIGLRPGIGDEAADATDADATDVAGTADPAATADAPGPAGVAPAPALPAHAEPEPSKPATGGLPAELLQNDELDPDLLPIFLEEGRDMLPQIGRELRAWQASLADTGHPAALLRLLHTIKGSARMAGAMTFGQHMHEMESRIEHICGLGAPTRDAIDDLLNRLDLALFMFDRLQNPQAAASDVVTGTPSAESGAALAANQLAVSQGSGTSAVAASQALGVRAGAAAAAAMSPVPLVRVRADVLDRLVNQAGEVSIARSRAETEVGGLRQSLVDLTENVSRLRTQLREIEIQAESQMMSQMASSTEREFDPLEFDRFTRLQELTRMMAESVNDVGSLQGTLSRTLDNTDAALISQARLTRELQQDLMRVRMVQFSSISERLYRVTRQVAKEVDKRVNLDLRGGTVEVDRGVLEKMAGPFEHLLRNAIVHGIESRADRAAAGKNEIGEIHIEVRQEGNEVVIQFADDGSGLDLERIRSKAQSVGLLDADAQPAEAELRDLIFHPGFTTASEVTALAGRGVGMDVVRSEAASLGGRIEIQSDAGQGARFLIRLPLTLAVTQVVLLAAGGKTFAVPSVLVEQVQQLKSGPLAAAYNEGGVMWQNRRVPLHYLSSLLGDTGSVPVSQQYCPVVILHSGNERVAIHVDEVIGNREVVVKNIGPQLSRLVGIAGATVLGTGDIVLILNPVPLAQRAASTLLRAPRITASDAPDDMGAVAEIGAPAELGSEPVQGLRSQSIVMVVDDSLTVRRVTQRLLTREGYQVVLAKDGIDALEQLQSITPDVMLLDIEMPRMDGFDLARNVRSDERTRAIPIIMITSRTAAKHRNYAMELGVNEYLGKPYQESELLGLVKGFVGREVVAG